MVVAWYAAKFLVVNQLVDVGVRSAHAAFGILLERDEVEGHVERVVEQQLADQRVADPEQQFERLGGLQRADGARQDAQHPALRAGGDQPRRRRFGEQAAVARSAAGVEDADLPVEAEDRAVHVGLAEEDGHVVGEVTGREIVGAVDQHVVIARDAHGVGGGERLIVDVHLDVRVEVEHLRARALDLELAYRGRAVDDLPLQVGRVDHIVVHQADAAHARRRQIERHGRAKSARADDQHRRVLQLPLTLQADLGDEQVA